MDEDHFVLFALFHQPIVGVSLTEESFIHRLIETLVVHTLLFSPK
jgi:hypothetical protein